MSEGINLAVVGVSSLVGEALVEILEQRDFPIETLFLLDHAEQAGRQLPFKDKSQKVTAAADFDFAQAGIAIFADDLELAEDYAQTAADQGVTVIDLSGAFRAEYDVPMVIPEVNPEALAEYANRGIVASPSALVVQTLLSIVPIHRQASVKRINLSTYQAVSSAAKAGVEELAGQTAKLLNAQTPENKAFPKQIAFNVLPQIGEIEENGYSREEMVIVHEVQKILGEHVQVNPSCVQVPVFFGHSANVNIECWDPMSAAEATELLNIATGVEVLDQETEEGFATAVNEAAKADEVFVSRIREDISCENAINLWVVADNIRKGAALNAVQIAEILTQQYI